MESLSYLHFCLTWLHNQGIPQLRFRFDDFLECTERTEVLYLYSYKGYNWGTAKCSKGGGWHRASMLSAYGIRSSHSPNTSIYSPTRKFHWVSVSGVFIQLSLCMHVWVSQCPCDWTQSPVSPCPHRLESGTVSFNSLILFLVSLEWPASPLKQSKSLPVTLTQAWSKGTHYE